MILPPIAQVGCVSACSTVTSSSSARVRPRNGPPDAVSVSRSTVPGRSPSISWCSAECSESTGMSCAPVASHSAITSSPPTTSDSLLASATSMPSVSATIVGPEPGRADDRVEHEVGAGLGDEPHEPLGPGEHLAVGPRLGGARGGVGVAERDPVDAVRARLRDQRLVRALGGEADELERLGRARDDVERLRADRAGRAEDQEPLHPATQCGTAFLRRPAKALGAQIRQDREHAPVVVAGRGAGRSLPKIAVTWRSTARSETNSVSEIAAVRPALGHQRRAPRARAR